MFSELSSFHWVLSYMFAICGTHYRPASKNFGRLLNTNILKITVRMIGITLIHFIFYGFFNKNEIIFFGMPEDMAVNHQDYSD